MIIEDEILVLKEVRYNDNDKILHALSKNNGKIQIVSRGCRKNKSPLVNISQIMAYSKCQLFVSRDMYILNSGELIDNFYNIRNNITAFLHGTYILELLSYISQENDVDGKAYEMNKIENIISIYELKLISMLGYRPQIKECILCGEKLNNKSLYSFNIKDGGIQCIPCIQCIDNNDCVNINISGIDISYKNIVLLNSMLMSKLDDEDIINSIGEDMNFLIRKYLFFHIGKSNFTTLKLLKKVDDGEY